MIFNSWNYIIFLVVIYFLYLFIPRHGWQNCFLLIASYYFYALFDWRYTFLLLSLTLVNYFSGWYIGITTNKSTKKLLLIVCLVISLGLLGFFKYYNFFLESVNYITSPAGISTDPWRLDIVLPIGISFFTFQLLSYTIDIYRGDLKFTRNFKEFALFASFFPQLTAGPIGRAKALLPQINRARVMDVDKFGSGIWLIFWGIYKKTVIADNLSPIVDSIYDNSSHSNFLMVYLGTIAFTFQIFSDFSGYSDIARGCARLLGIELMRNFDLPYFSQNPREFWQRWHISLSTWLRDYVYIPLGGNRINYFRTNINLFLTMFIGGLWHGASWNFGLWGGYHGILLIVHRYFTQNSKQLTYNPSFTIRLLKRVFCFHCILFGWLLFRSNRRIIEGEYFRDDSFSQILELITSFKIGWGFDMLSVDLMGKILFFIIPLIVIQWLQYKHNDHYIIFKFPLIIKALIVAILGFSIIAFGVQSGASFIYFQF